MQVRNEAGLASINEMCWDLLFMHHLLSAWRELDLSKYIYKDAGQD